jgi:hypothetical protein
MDLMDKYFPLTDDQVKAMAEFDRLMDVAEAHADADEVAQYDALRAQAYAVINAVGMTEPR